MTDSAENFNRFEEILDMLKESRELSETLTLENQNLKVEIENMQILIDELLNALKVPENVNIVVALNKQKKIEVSIQDRDIPNSGFITLQEHIKHMDCKSQLKDIKTVDDFLKEF